MDKTMHQMRGEILAAFSPSQIAAYEKFACWLTASGVTEQALKPGDHAPDFILPDADGRLVFSHSLREQGPLVVSFFHGDWCPFCVAELCALQAVLPQIEDLRATLVAISPETGDFPRMLKRRFGLARLQILADVDYGVSLAFGVIFSVPGEVRDYYRQNDIDLPARHGSPAWMLPISATYTIGEDGIIRDAYVEADFTLRQEPSVIIERLRRIIADTGRRQKPRD